MCNKIKQPTTYHAAQMIINLKAKGKIKKGTVLGGYYCNECNAYHVTSRPGPNCIIKTRV